MPDVRPTAMRLGRVALAIAFLSAAAALMAGAGQGAGWWHFRTGFTILRWAAIGGAVAALLGLIAGVAALIRGRRLVVLAVLALVLGGAVAYIPWSWKRLAQRVPPIHDITTDTQDPPRFEAVLPARAGAPNSAEYGGAEIAEQQRLAYPDIQPLRLATGPDETFDRALAAARGMGWEIVATEPERGRIEATATTRFFRFKDDVVIRVRADDEGSVIDVRSVSRVGVSDIGTNAKRIRTYLSRLSGG